MITKSGAVFFYNNSVHFRLWNGRDFLHTYSKEEKIQIILYAANKLKEQYEMLKAQLD